MDMDSKKVRLRKADASDMDLLFQWANDPVTRQNAFHTKQITYEEHIKWFHRMLSDKKQVQYICMNGMEAIGQVRLSIHDTIAEIDYSVAPSVRGNGYGRKIIELTCDMVKVNHPEIHKLVGQVKYGNHSSEKCFQRNGFQECFTQFEWNCEEQ